MNQVRTARALRRHRPDGFTLIEVMITVAIVGILTAIALPSYRNYAIRGKLVEGTNALAAMRSVMEQYYQDNRTYLSIPASGSIPAISSPCSFGSAYPSTAGTFTLSCSNWTATTYILTATASTGLASGASYTVDQTNAMATAAYPTPWGTVPTNTCWLMRKGDAC